MPQAINLALQGGGSHGAYTWGVLDALLEDQRFSFEAVSGASAGGLNAALFASGYAKGADHAKACRAARATLKAFWTQLAKEPGFYSVFGAAASNVMLGFDLLTRIASPYQFNPLNINPLRELITSHVNFEALHSGPIRVCIGATDVRTGRARIFTGSQITCEALMASACLPHVFQAVEIEGRAYWDGGYSGNPPLYPLYTSATEDTLLVKINPLDRDSLPDHAAEIVERINEISFNTPLLQELRAIAFVQRLLADGVIKAGPKRARSKGSGYKRIRMHLIDGGLDLQAFGASSKFNTSEAFITQLFKLGRKRTRAWLRTDAEHVGVQSGFDIASLLTAPGS